MINKGRERVEKPLRDNLRLTLDLDSTGASSRKGDAGQEKIARLLDLIGNEQFSIRTAATKKLTSLGERAVPALLTVLGEGLWYARECAAQALGEIGSPRAIEPLLVSLRDENVGVRQAAARALSSMVEQEKLSEVAEAIARTDYNTQRHVLEAIRKASPLAGRELDGILGKQLESTGKEQEKIADEQTPSEDLGLPAAEDKSNWSLWKRLRRLLQTWS